MSATCPWSLGNGQTLGFTICNCTTTGWSKVAGLYIFAYIYTANGKQYWKALYIGQTNDFSYRMPTHERFDEAVRKGATHIHAVAVPQAANRDTWEKLLISTYQPSMNEQHKSLNRFAV
jgi:predicted GIY-YIG superfamily endonuclease